MGIFYLVKSRWLFLRFYFRIIRRLIWEALDRAWRVQLCLHRVRWLEIQLCPLPGWKVETWWVLSLIRLVSGVPRLPPSRWELRVQNIQWLGLLALIVSWICGTSALWWWQSYANNDEGLKRLCNSLCPCSDHTLKRLGALLMPIRLSNFVSSNSYRRLCHQIPFKANTEQ